MPEQKTLKMLVTDKRKALYSFNTEAETALARAVGEADYFAYRDLWKKTSSLEVELDFPLQLDFELNTGCNLTCPMCPGGMKTAAQKLMDFKMYKDIIDEGVACGAKAVNFNFINEPLLRKDIGAFIDYARKKGMLDIMFNTNGMLLGAEMSGQLISAGLTKLSVSLDAFTEQAYLKMRPGADFEKVKDNILNFLNMRSQLKSRLPLLKLTFLATAVNYHELDDFLYFWQDKADMVSLQNMTDGFEGEQSRRLQEVFGIKDDNSYVDLNYKCAQPFQRMTIRHDGTVLACCSLGGSKALKIGDIKEQGLRGIYHSGLARKIRTKIKCGEIREIPACLRCIKNTPLRIFK